MSKVTDKAHRGDRGCCAFNTAANNEVENYDKPKLRHKKKYPSPISFRPTDKERELLLSDAGDMSLSAYIRQSLFGRKASKRVVPEVDRVLLAQILAKLGESRIANNLNQIAYHTNCGSLLLDDVTVEEITEACLSGRLDENAAHQGT